MLISNYTSKDKVQEFFDEKLYHMSEFKIDYYLHGKQYCIEKYGSKLKIIKSITSYQTTFVHLIKTNNTDFDQNTDLFLSNINIFERNDMIKVFGNILSTMEFSQHKILSNDDLEEYNIYKDEEKYNVLHVMRDMNLRDLYDNIDFQIELYFNICMIFHIILYNYPNEFARNLYNIFSESFEDIEFEIEPVLFDMSTI